MSSPLVTVLMPVYNSDQYLAEAIESILEQAYQDFELLIIDDGSTDNSYQIASSYQDSRIIINRYKKNVGLVKSLNRGIKLARGKYIIRMDADDISVTDRITHQVKYMESNLDVGACGSWVAIFGKNNSTWKYPSSHGEITTQLFFESAIAHPVACIRKSVLIKNKITYSSDYEYAEDYKLWIDLAQVTKLTNIPRVLLHYRTHPAQIGSDKHAQQSKINEKIRLKQFTVLMGRVSKRDQSTHLLATSWHKNATKQEILSIGKWYQKLISANQNKQLYGQTIFTGLIADHWLAVCYLAKNLGVRRYLLVLLHPILMIMGVLRLVCRRLS